MTVTESKDIKSISKKRNQIAPDRIVLDTETMTVVKRISDQLTDAFSGIVKLKTKEIVNFVLQSRPHLLDKAELKAIRKKHFDDVRAAQWALGQLQAAKERGENLTLQDVLGKIQAPANADKSDSLPVKLRIKKAAATAEAIETRFDTAPQSEPVSGHKSPET